ncbi:hypothetical protein FRB94_003261 [Tulasnella sp. JGI-2019a]|nr:hypothetical protein FRB94_003261 [Tulasnella sp. JGI-2019a]
MHGSSALTFFLFIVLVSARPASQRQRRSAAVIPFHHKQISSRQDSSSPKVFNKDAALSEVTYVVSKYANTPGNTKRHQVPQPRSNVGAQSNSKHFDVALQRRQSSGKEPLKDEFQDVDAFYWGPLTVGTPAQPSSCTFDTGSSDLVLPLTSCTKNCSGEHFDSAKSTTFKDTGDRFSVQYVDGSGATGTVVFDSVTIAGLNVPRQGFGAVSEEFGGFGHGPNAGLLGLGFSANSRSETTPLFENLVQQGTLASNIFSFYLARHGANGSELCLGCMDSHKFTGEINYVPLDPSVTGGVQKYWNVPSDGIIHSNRTNGTASTPALDSSSTLVSHNGTTGTNGTSGTSETAFAAALDSGTTLVYVAPEIATALYAQIPGSKPAPPTVAAGFFTFPCDTELGVTSIKFDGKPYAINPLDFNIGTILPGSPECVGAVVGLNVGNGLAVLGDVFLKGTYTIYDYDGKQVGFAALAPGLN